MASAQCCQIYLGKSDQNGPKLRPDLSLQDLILMLLKARQRRLQNAKNHISEENFLAEMDIQIFFHQYK
jgi:hypothetical protein